jgi:hypothetical protein
MNNLASLQAQITRLVEAQRGFEVFSDGYDRIDKRISELRAQAAPLEKEEAERQERKEEAERQARDREAERQARVKIAVEERKTEEAKAVQETAKSRTRVAELQADIRAPPDAISTDELNEFKKAAAEAFPLDTLCRDEKSGMWWDVPTNGKEDARQVVWNKAISDNLLGRSISRKFVDGHSKRQLGNFAPDAVLVSSSYSSGPYPVTDIYAIVDVKDNGKNEHADSLKRLWEYSRTIFKGDQLRSKILMATCDLQHVNFYVFHKSRKAIDSFPSLPCDNYLSTGSVALRHLLTVDSDKIWFPLLKLRPLMLALQGSERGVFGKQLGLSGACGTVYAVGTDMVLKAFNQGESDASNTVKRDLEAKFINEVRGKAGDDGSIKLHLPEVVQKVGETGLLLRPRGSHEGATLRSFVELLGVFKWLHGTVNKVHRDVRPSNLVVVDHPLRLVLIDWGCLCEVGKSVPYCGTLTTAADDILQPAMGSVMTTVPAPSRAGATNTRATTSASESFELITQYIPSGVHDLVAFVRSFFMVLCPGQITITKEASRSDQARVILDAWGGFKNDNYKTALAAALESKYDAIALAFEAEWGASRESVSWGR